jgi:hypothetical protein
MSGEVQRNLRGALRMLLKPLVRLFINQGVTHSDFSDVAKDVYVEMAIRHFTDDARINQSRIAVLTGLTRKEVKNVLVRAASSQVGGQGFSRPSKVLMGWYSDPEFQGPYGLPLVLPYDSNNEKEKTFKSLVKIYGADMAPKQMYEVLLRSGAISEPEQGVLKVVRRSFEPTGLSPELIERFGNIAHNFFLTAAGNVEKKSQGDAFLERVVTSTRRWTSDELSEFTELSKARGQELLEYIDNWIVQQGDDEGRGSAIEKKESGLGIYHYIESTEYKSSLKDLVNEREPDFKEE